MIVITMLVSITVKNLRRRHYSESGRGRKNRIRETGQKGKQLQEVDCGGTVPYNEVHVLRAPRWPTHHEADVGSAARRGQCGQPTDAWTKAYVRLFDGLFSASRPCVYSWMSDADVARLGFRGVDTAGRRRLEGARSASVRYGLLESCSCGTDRQVLKTYQQDIVSCKHIPEL